MNHTGRVLFLLLLATLVACNAPNPATPLLTPTIAASVRPAVSPSLIPTLSSASIPSAAAPTNEPTPIPAQPALDPSLMPALEKTIPLSPVRFHDFFASTALDEQAERLYISLSPSRTVILDTKTLAHVGEIPAGGPLSVNPAAQRLYIGVPGSSLDKADGTRVITPAELQMFDTTNLTMLRSAVFSATATTAPQVAVDMLRGKIYVTQAGVYVADATTLAVSDILSGTFPSSPEPLWAAYASSAIVDPLRQRLWVNIWGDPKLNPPYVLLYDLSSAQVIARLPEGYNIAAIDPDTGEAFADANYAKVKYDAQGQKLKRLANVTGSMYLDAAHDRVYVFDCDYTQTIKVLDRDLNFLGYVSCDGLDQIHSVVVDPGPDRLLALLADGQLAVLQGHARPGGPQAFAPPPRQAVQWIALSSTSAVDQTFYATFGLDQYNVGHGTLYHSRDAGATWELANGLPADVVADLEYADHAIFATAGGDGITDGYGIWRSNDGGQTWQLASQGLTDLGVTRLAVSPDFAHDGTLFASSPRGVFRSTDRGTTWVPLADRYAPLLKDLTVTLHALALSPNFAQDNTLLIGHTSGLWRSTDRGETWTSTSGGPHATRLAYAPDGSMVFAADYDGVHRSIDGGQTWQLFNAGLDLSNSIAGEVQANDREAVVLLTSFARPGSVYHLALSETTWQRMPIEADVSALALTTGDQLFIGTQAGLVQRVK